MVLPNIYVKRNQKNCLKQKQTKQTDKTQKEQKSPGLLPRAMMNASFWMTWTQISSGELSRRVESGSIWKRKSEKFPPRLLLCLLVFHGLSGFFVEEKDDKAKRTREKMWLGGRSANCCFVKQSCFTAIFRLRSTFGARR